MVTSSLACIHGQVTKHTTAKWTIADAKSQTGLYYCEADFLAHSQNMLRSLLHLFLALLAQYNDEDLKSDYLTRNWHPNKINTRCLSPSYGNTIPCDLFRHVLTYKLPQDDKTCQWVIKTINV